MKRFFLALTAALLAGTFASSVSALALTKQQKCELKGALVGALTDGKQNINCNPKPTPAQPAPTQPKPVVPTPQPPATAVAPIPSAPPTNPDTIYYPKSSWAPDRSPRPKARPDSLPHSKHIFAPHQAATQFSFVPQPATGPTDGGVPKIFVSRNTIRLCTMYLVNNRSQGDQFLLLDPCERYKPPYPRALPGMDQYGNHVFFKREGSDWGQFRLDDPFLP